MTMDCKCDDHDNDATCAIEPTLFKHLISVYLICYPQLSGTFSG